MNFNLYLDEDRIAGVLVAGLRRAGFDVVSCREAGRLGYADEEQLEFSTSLGRVLYSANVRDYARIHGEWLAIDRRHAGIIVCNQQGWSIGEQIRRLALVSERHTSAELSASIVHLSNFS